MKIIVDNKIPYIQKAIERIADEVVYIPGKDFTPELVRDADALIIRTRTHCNRELLEGSQVKFIATATIGFDHIDTEYCRKAGITWANAPGCNSASVAQYIESVLALLKLVKGKELHKMCIGIVGVGNVGGKIIDVAQKQGMRVLLNDLPREEKEGNTNFCSLEQIARECDVITFHVPLYKDGKYKTFHLADEVFFRSLKRKPVIINTSRGEVIETQALCRYFGIKTTYNITPIQPENLAIQAATTEEAWLKIYDPQQDSNRLKAHPEQFEQLRGDYPLRREKAAYHISIS